MNTNSQTFYCDSDAGSNEVASLFEKEMVTWYVTFGRYICDIPKTSALEFQYALNHLCLALSDDEPDDEFVDQVRHLEKATGHIHRAHLDFLKVQLGNMQRELQILLHPASLHSGMEQGKLRLKELETLGKKDRGFIFDCYRDLLDTLIEKMPEALEAREEKAWPHKSPRRRPPALLAPGVGGQGMPLAGDLLAHRDLYWKWVGLEAQLAALTGERNYDTIVKIVDNYNNSTLGDYLPIAVAEMEQALISQNMALMKIVDPSSPWFAQFESEGEFARHWESCCEASAVRKAFENDFQDIGEKLRNVKPGDETYPELQTRYAGLGEDYKQATENWLQKTIGLGARLGSFQPPVLLGD